MSGHGAGSLVAVHIPKTAGTSFGGLLAALHGDGLHRDDVDRPLATARWLRRARALGHGARLAGRELPWACVYGHFMPLKYAWLRDARYCVWLRDPVQRVVSRYHHYLRHDQQDSPHARWGLVPGLDLEGFASLPQYRNTYAEYLWGFPLRRFDFVGIVEDYAAEAERFAHTFGLPGGLPALSLNENPARGADGYHVGSRLERLIRRANALDVRLYEQALAARR